MSKGVWGGKEWSAKVATGDIWFVTLRGWYDGMAVRNVVTFRYQEYQGLGGPVGPLELATAFKNTLMPDLVLITHAVQAYDEVEVVKVKGADAGVGAILNIPSTEGTGTVTGDAMPSEICFSFRMNRPNRSFRHGWKRFPGVPENWVNKGFITWPVSNPQETVKVRLLSDISINLDTRIFPVLVATTNLDGVTLPEPVYAEPTGGQWNMYTGTQNTRKRGRGR